MLVGGAHYNKRVSCSMDFDPAKYGPEVARVLALDGNGNRLSPLPAAPAPARKRTSF